jgi:hypothetical protein
MKTYRIYEADLETLERELPRLMEKSDCNDTLTRKRWEAVKEVVANVQAVAPATLDSASPNDVMAG